MECLKISGSFSHIVFIAVVARKTLKGRGVDKGVLLQFQRWIGMQGLWLFTVAIMNIYSAEAPGPLQMLGRPVDDRLLEQMEVYWRYL